MFVLLTKRCRLCGDCSTWPCARGCWGESTRLRLGRDFIGCPDLLLILVNIYPIKYQFDQYFYCTANNLLIPLLFYLLGPHFLLIWQTNLLIYPSLPNSLTNHQSFHRSSLKLSHLFQIFCAVGKPMFYHFF